MQDYQAVTYLLHAVNFSSVRASGVMFSWGGPGHIPGKEGRLDKNRVILRELTVNCFAVFCVYFSGSVRVCLDAAQSLCAMQTVSAAVDGS